MVYRGEVGEYFVGGVECASSIRSGFDSFNIAIMPGEACSLFFSIFIRLAIRKQKILYYYNGVRMVRHRRSWSPLPLPLLLLLMLLPSCLFSVLSPFHPLTSICRLYDNFTLAIKKTTRVLMLAKKIVLSAFMDRNAGSVTGYRPP